MDSRLSRVWSLGTILTGAGIVGARVYFLILHPGQSLDPAGLVGSNGSAFYGALVAVPGAVGIYLWRRHLSVRYLDAIAVGLAFGYAVGPGGRSHLRRAPRGRQPPPLGDRLHPIPEPRFPALASPTSPVPCMTSSSAWRSSLCSARCGDGCGQRWPPGWFVGLYALGRFAMFFFRSDSPRSALGLKTEQWVSLGLLAVALLGGWWSHQQPWAQPPRTQSGVSPGPATTA
ncbi:MAG: prolipoprotein diacylglyceryl transferase family protein [Solirubrobacteraceae bacterium]